MYLSHEKFLVMGVSRSGIIAAEFLLEKKATVYLYDENYKDTDKNIIQGLIEKGAMIVQTDRVTDVAEECDHLVLSPGVPIDHPIAVLFKRMNKRIIGESELACLYTQALSVGITGTNGKTTTVTMLGEVLKCDNKEHLLCGNIGTPYLSARSLSEEGIAVVEVSSFQLETLSSFRPHIACVLNITEDHLNRHYNMDNYIFLKKKILKNLTESEYAVLNADDVTVCNFSGETRAKVKYFSLEKKVDGAYLSGTDLCYGEEKILSIEELVVTGKHNVINALAVICMAKILKISNERIAEGLKNFKGVRHRIETVDLVGDVTYINDSKGTNVDATIKAIECMKQETYLMLGGKDKGYDYRALFQKIKNSYVIHTILYGENRYKLLTAALECHFEKITLCEKFSHAFLLASIMAKKAQTVLLSPASASFDEFSSFEERGDRFIEEVKKRKREVESVELNH